jgi:parallel beta-helix repeat protein
MSLNTGHIVNNRYRIVKRLGEGGFGAVYKAWDLNLNSPCALKENLETSPQATKQFTLEATLLATLRHPNLPRVTDHFSMPGQGQYLVMDFIEGEDLQQAFERNGRMAEQQVIPWMIDVCDALVYLHGQPSAIIHRDVKPANIKVTPQGRSVLVDFGIAKIYDPHRKTTQGAQAVTPPYSPFEQYGKGRTDARTDLYALGMTLYVLLTGFEPPESIARLAGDLMDAPRQHNPALTPALETVILKATAVMPDQRYQTAGELKADLISLRNGNAPVSLVGTVTPVAVSYSHPAKTVANTIIVSAGGSGHYRTISDALHNASEGAQIQVQPGQYDESLLIKRPVELVATGDAASTILTSSKGAVITSLSSHALVRGFTLSARSLLASNKAHAVDISQGELNVEDCDISSDTLAAVCIAGRKTTANLTHCQVHGSRESGILLENGARARIEDCDIYENQYPGITISGGSGPTVMNCRIFDNATGGLHILGRSGGTF